MHRKNINSFNFKNLTTMIKNLIYCTMLGAAILTGCAGGGNNGATQNTEKTEPLKFQRFQDSVGFVANNVTHFAISMVDFPVSGPEALVNVLKGILAERYQLPIDDAKDGKTFVNKVATSNLDRVRDVVNDDIANEVPMDMGYYIESNIIKLYENDKIITLGSGGYDFLGGTHGLGHSLGVTLRKSDGKVISKDILKADAWNQLQDKVAASLCKFLEVENNEELYDILNKENIKYDEATKTLTIPAPQNQPFIVNDTVFFPYSDSEITPHAVGLPEVALPIKDIKSHLNPEVAELFK